MPPKKSKTVGNVARFHTKKEVLRDYVGKKRTSRVGQAGSSKELLKFAGSTPKENTNFAQEVAKEVRKSITLPNFGELELKSTERLEKEINELKEKLDIATQEIGKNPRRMWNGGAMVAGVKEVIAGANISISGTDPVYPIINAVGAGLGDVSGPASAVDSNFASYDGTTGNLIKDSGSKAADFAPAAHAHEGTAILSTGETGGTKYLREDGDGTSSWQAIAAGGNVSKVGTPVNNQVGVWTGDGTIEGDVALTFDTATYTLTGGVEAGYFAILGKTATTADTDGASVEIQAGNRTGTGTSGSLSLSSGEKTLAGEDYSSITLDGGTGAVSINAVGSVGVDASGDLSFGSDATGAIQFINADTFTVPSAGDILFATSDGTDYKFKADSTVHGVLNFASVATTDKTFTFPNTTGTLALVANPTTITPATNDGAALGTTALQYSDLFLAEGGVINWDNGDATLTQTGNVLKLAGAALETDDNIELGHASDTTLSRVSAGVVAVEGVNLVKENSNASAAEINTGTSTTKFNTPDALAGSYAGTKSLSVQVYDGTTDVATGDGKAYITIPEALNGMNLVRAQATVVTAGTTNATTVMIHNKTDAQDMLSGAISIASGGTVATVGTVNASYDDVATNDVLRIDVDSVSTTAPKGLMVVLEFRLP